MAHVEAQAPGTAVDAHERRASARRSQNGSDRSISARPSLRDSHQQNELLIGLLALFVVGMILFLEYRWLVQAGRADGGGAARAAIASWRELTAYAPRRDEIGAFAQALIHHFQLVQSQQQLASQQQQGLSERLARQESFRRESMSFQARIAEIVQRLEGHAGRMSTASGNLVTISSEADARAAASAQSTQRVSGHVDVVASSIRDIAATLTDVVGDAERTSAVAAAARSLVAAAKNDVNALTEAARTIEPVIGLIEDVANQTNLLALNATIEAARAGEMGRGFGVVAHEVKQLATRTARATEEVRSGLHGISAASARIVERVAKLVDSIEQVDAVAAAIADSMRRQDANSQTITSNTGRAANDVREVAATVKDVAAIITRCQAGRRSGDQGVRRSRPAGRRPEVRGGAVHRDDRKDRRMTMASMPGAACGSRGAALCDPLLPHAGEGVSLADGGAGGVHGLVGGDRQAAQRRLLVGHAVHAAQDHRRHHAGRGADAAVLSDRAVVDRRRSRRGRAARSLHWLLYAIVILVPLAGWAGISDFGAREIFPGFTLPAIWPEHAGYADFLFTFHAYLAFGLLALVALHIGIAMQDYMMRADDPKPRD